MSPIVRDIARILDIPGTLRTRNVYTYVGSKTESPHASVVRDQQAMYADWAAIGADLQSAIAEYGQQLPRSHAKNDMRR